MTKINGIQHGIYKRRAERHIFNNRNAIER